MSTRLTEMQIENAEMTSRYLRDQLSPEETTAFEEYLMEHPEVLEQLQIDEMFIESMPGVEIENLPELKSSARSPLWSNIKWLGFGAIGAYASVALFSLVSTNNTMMNIDRVVYVETVRSSVAEHMRIGLGDKRENMVLMLSSDFDQIGPFNVQIIRADTNRVVAEFYDLPKTETEDIAIVINTGVVEAGKYFVKIHESDSNVTVKEISFY